MSDKNDGGDKTEKPTPQRLEDARKKGDVPKSQDMSQGVTLLAGVVALHYAAGQYVDVLLPGNRRRSYSLATQAR